MKELFKTKTFYVALVFLALVIVPVVTGVVIPEWAFGILGAVGLGTLRAGVTKISGNTGWKTYAAAVAVALVSVASALGVQLPLDIIYGILGSFGIVGVRDAIIN